METLILNIAKELLAVSIGFIALVFTSLSILMTLKDDNWKIESLKKSKTFKDFISLNTNTVFGFIVLLIIEELNLLDKNLIYALCIYLVYLAYLLFNVGLIAYKYKKIIILMSDNTKPTISV